eukprot:SAG31_NODE_3473_length_4234_cov_1.624667_4_plen_195_part_00
MMMMTRAATVLNLVSYENYGNFDPSDHPSHRIELNLDLVASMRYGCSARADRGDEHEKVQHCCPKRPNTRTPAARRGAVAWLLHACPQTAVARLGSQCPMPGNGQWARGILGIIPRRPWAHGLVSRIVRRIPYKRITYFLSRPPSVLSRLPSRAHFAAARVLFPRELLSSRGSHKQPVNDTHPQYYDVHTSRSS